MTIPNNDNCLSVSGSAFNGNTTQGHHVISSLKNRQQTNYVSLSDWCEGNFITKRIGYTLIKRKLLIAQKLYGQWWVCANIDCLDELLDYLGLEQLYFDANNSEL